MELELWEVPKNEKKLLYFKGEVSNSLYESTLDHVPNSWT